MLRSHSARRPRGSQVAFFCVVLMVFGGLSEDLSEIYQVGVCGGFSESGLPEAVSFVELFGIAIAHLAWARRAPGLLEAPPEGFQSFDVQMSASDTEGNAGKSLICAMEEWQSGALVVLATGYSSLTTPVALVGPTLQGAQVDWGSTTPTLSDKSVYGYYSRSIASDDAVAVHMAGLLTVTWNYKRLLILYERSSYGLPIMQSFTEELASAVVAEPVALPGSPSQADVETIRRQMRSSMKLQMRIVFFVALAMQTYQVLVEDEFQGRLLGSGYLWIGPPDLIATGFKFLSTAQKELFVGSLTLGAEDLGSSERLEAFSNFTRTLTLEDFDSELIRAVLPCNGSNVTNLGELRTGPGPDCPWGGLDFLQDPGQDTYMLHAFDAMALVFYTVNRLLGSSEDPTTMSGSDFVSALRNTTFEGLTGTVRLDEQGDRIPSTFSLTLVKASSLYEVVGTYEPVSQTVVWLSTPTFSGGTDNLPEDSFPDCPAGEYRDYLTLECVECAAGHYAQVSGSTTCLQCAAGTYANRTGSTTCSVCLPGYYQSEVASLACSPCPAGRSQSLPGSETCEVCDAGHYQSETGATECDRCPTGYYGGGEASSTSCTKCPGIHTTQGLGFAEATDCLCPTDTYTLNGTTCIACGDGADCAGFGAEPKSLPGYHLAAVTDSGLSIFECTSNHFRCPGGVVDTCAPGRQGTACGECLPNMMSRGDGSCVECPELTFLPGLIAGVVMLTALTILYSKVGVSDRTQHSHSWLLITASCAQLLGVCQLMGILSRVTVSWQDPVELILDAMSIFNFNVDFFKPNCVARFRPLALYAVTLLLPWLGMLYLLIVHVFASIVFYKFDLRANRKALVGSCGTVAMAFFIAICVSVLTPLQCDDHPNHKWTVVEYPTVLCWEGTTHQVMVLLSFIGMSLPICFVSLVCQLLRAFPEKMATGSVNFLNTYAFLWERVKPERRWYVLVHLIRNLVVAMVPVLPGDFWQVSTLQIIFNISIAGFCIALPWRLMLTNVMEILVLFFVLRLVSVAAFFSTGVDENTVAWITVGLCTVLVVPLVLAVPYGLWKRFGPMRKSYKYFLCHHKAAAGSFARLLKLQLVEDEKRDNTFIDSDNLSDLDSLFEVVARNVDNLVVIGTAEVLTRPWCLGEVITAYLNNVRVRPVVFADFDMPPDAFIKDIYNIVDFSVLAQHGIDDSHAQDALWAFQALRTIRISKNFDSYTIRSLSKGLQTASSEVSVASHRRSFPSEEANIVISFDPSNREARASALILVKFLRMSMAQDTVTHLSPILFDNSQVAQLDLTITNRASISSFAAHVNASSFVLLCSSNCFANETFLGSILWCSQACVGHVVPVSIGDQFRFPSAAFYESVRQDMVAMFAKGNVAPLELIEDDVSDMLQYIKDIFKIIALTLHTAGQEKLLEMQASLIRDRLKQNMRHRSKTVSQKSRFFARHSSMLSKMSSVETSEMEVSPTHVGSADAADLTIAPSGQIHV